MNDDASVPRVLVCPRLPARHLGELRCAPLRRAARPVLRLVWDAHVFEELFPDGAVALDAANALQDRVSLSRVLPVMHSQRAGVFEYDQRRRVVLPVLIDRDVGLHELDTSQRLVQLH